MALGALVQDFQTLIVGVIGFAGVIITLVLNARYAREQRREERHHECQSLRTALIEELRINRESLAHNIDAINNGVSVPSETGGYAMPTHPMDDAYRAFTHRLGLLTRAEVSKVMFAYLSLRTYHTSLFLIGVPTHASDRYVKVPAQNAQLLSGGLKSLIGPIEGAIEVLERARDAG